MIDRATMYGTPRRGRRRGGAEKAEAMAEADASEYLGFEEIWSVAPAFKIVNFNSLGNIGPLGAVVSNAGSAFRVRRSSHVHHRHEFGHMCLCASIVTCPLIRSDQTTPSYPWTFPSQPLAYP